MSLDNIVVTMAIQENIAIPSVFVKTSRNYDEIHTQRVALRNFLTPYLEVNICTSGRKFQNFARFMLNRLKSVSNQANIFGKYSTNRNK